VQYL